MSIFSSARQATLPEDCDEHTIDCMSTGEVGYTTPWGMWVDASRECWLHPKYPIEARPFGTLAMRVELREDGYHVWLVPGEKYQPRAEPGYCSPVNTEYLPVVELHR